MSSAKEVVIKSIDEIESLLARAYWLEEEFEGVTQWEAYTSVEDKYKELLFRLSHESEGHKESLKKLISNVEGLDMDAIKQNSQARNEIKFKKHTEDVEILYEVYENDQLALDLYQKIHSMTSHEFVEEVWNGDDPEEFFEILSDIIKEEKEHINALGQYAQKLGRVK
ncbi:MAG: hypothetical protein KGY76_00125 [Candidatus Thermoplasmatota archaeon]|nr:hypothetical protein [Candidatus Thermoplasmatota archaeon]